MLFIYYINYLHALSLYGKNGGNRWPEKRAAKKAPKSLPEYTKS